MPNSGKVAVVTGGTSGIGAACAEKLLIDGWSVVVIGRSGEKAGLLIAQLGHLGEISAVIGDVASSAFCDFAVEKTLTRHGRLDGVVNSAGIMRRGTAEETSDIEWHETLAANVSGTFFMCRAAIPAIRRSGRGGAIVNIASDWGLVGGAGHVAYCASKGAVVNMTRALALDHTREGIGINALCPGEVRTPMLDAGLAMDGQTTAERFEAFGRTIPIGRISEPMEQASMVAFLLSDAASFVVGSVIAADGGATAR
jgi:meso-butanediol dehydrogenase/(S,S)-butanediol dehydrogenase/diacetyl reductase